MRQTVIGLFNTYAEADGARNALVQSGFAYHEVELRANPETASDAIAKRSEDECAQCGAQQSRREQSSEIGNRDPACSGDGAGHEPDDLGVEAIHQYDQKTDRDDPDPVFAERPAIDNRVNAYFHGFRSGLATRLTSAEPATALPTIERDSYR